jgi:hypothetical protein
MIATDTLIFIGIVGVLVLIVLAILSLVIRFFIKLISGLFRKILDQANPNKDQGADLGVAVKELEVSKDERLQLEEEQKKSGPSAKLDYDNYHKDSEKAGKTQSFEEKEKKDIDDSLAKLKTENSEGKSTLESKMPSRDNEENIDEHAKIEIPRKKIFGGDSVKILNVDGNSEKTGIAGANPQEKSIKGIQESLSRFKTGENSLESKMPSRLENQIENNSRGGIKTSTATNSVENLLKSPFGKKEINRSSDSSVFNGKEEVSRVELKHELMKDAKVWQAAKQSGLTLSPVERAKLIKEIPQVYGRNVSKSDLKLTIKKLSQKMVGSQNPEEHARLRKEVKFFKKIGGIK